MYSITALSQQERQLIEEYLRRNFPYLEPDNHELQSPWTIEYNCIAYAADRFSKPWWPAPSASARDYDWPIASRLQTVECFVEAFRTLGYEPCDSDVLEPGFEKVAIYADSDLKPLHMAKQLVRLGVWGSKIGDNVDMHHATPQVLHSSVYGRVVQVMKRPIPAGCKR